MKFDMFGVSGVNPMFARSHTAKGNYIGRSTSEVQTRHGFQASEKPLHKGTHSRLLHTNPFTHSFHTEAPLHRAAFTPRSFYSLHRKVFTQRDFTHQNFYTQKPLDKATFTHSRLYAQKLLHTKASTHKRFYTQKLLHRAELTQKNFYKQRFLHTAFTHRSFYTEEHFHREAFTHRSFYTQMLLHTEAFTHRSFCSENPLHRAALTHSNFYTRKPLHRADSTQKSFLHREAFTHTSHLPLSAEPSAQFSQLQSAQTTLTAAPWQAPCCGTLQRHQHARFKTHIYPTYPLLEVRTPIASLSGENPFWGSILNRPIYTSYCDQYLNVVLSCCIPICCETSHPDLAKDGDSGQCHAIRPVRSLHASSSKKAFHDLPPSIWSAASSLARIHKRKLILEN